MNHRTDTPVGIPDLPLAGVIPFSATDWPGMLTVTAFTQGCPWRCVYCHNPTLQELHAGTHTFADAVEVLCKRAGLIDGLVISGGEPTIHRTLGSAIAAVHRLGWPVGVHTCGYLPSRLRQLLADPLTRPDWIGLDVKALRDDLPTVTGCSPRGAAAAWDSLDVVVDCAKTTGMGLQVRTTVWPGSVVEAGLDRMRQLVSAYGYELVVQWARDVDSCGNYLGNGATMRA